VQSLRDLKEILASAQLFGDSGGPETQHRYLLQAGGADVGFAGAAEIESTPVVCSPAMQPALDRSVVQCSTEDCAIAGPITETASRKRRGSGTGRGGAR
jgi:hypothetical protein